MERRSPIALSAKGVPLGIVPANGFTKETAGVVSGTKLKDFAPYCHGVTLMMETSEGSCLF